jgi:excisionase family DNA binding protein
MPAQTPQHEFLTVPEAAELLRLRPSTLRSWILNRKIGYIKLGPRAVRFRRSDLEALMTGSSVPAEAQ